MSTVIITEKPSVAQEYIKVLQVERGAKTNGYVEGKSHRLNENVIITWAVGHLIAIAEPQNQKDEWNIEGGWKMLRPYLPLMPQVYKYVANPSTYDQFKVVKSIYTRNDINRIYYAGDSGREGIYIQALIRNQIFKTKPAHIDERVVWIDSYTEESILNGVKNAKPYDDYQPMIDAGYARAIADWLIGMNFTMAATLSSGTLIKTGRVMSPTLAMVVRRQEEIDNFKKTPFYGVEAKMENAKGVFWKAVKGTHFFESDLLYNENGFIRKEHAEKLISGFVRDKRLKVDDVKVQEKKEYAPYLFNLADLQAYCSRTFHISPTDALNVAQALYEKKFTTYPRTDARFLSTAVAEEYKKKFGHDIPKRYIDDSKITDHYAIIPTFSGDASSLTGLEESVYKAILKRYMDTMKPPYVYDAISITYIHAIGEKFFESYRKVKQKGFKEGEKTDEKDVKEGEEEINKPIPEKGTVLPVNDFALREMETKPPVPYTTGSLILAMEKAGKLIEDEELREQIKTCGIGTSATRASIIEKLKDTKYITIDKNQKVAPTDLGKRIVPFIAKYDEALVSPIKTAEMEEHLNEIATGKLTITQYRSLIEAYVKETTKNILAAQGEFKGISVNGKEPSATYKCPKCEGEVLKGKFGWYCKDKCGFYPKQKIFGMELSDDQVEKLLSGKEVKMNSKNCTVLPKIEEKEWNGKKYLNWVIKSAPKKK